MQKTDSVTSGVVIPKLQPDRQAGRYQWTERTVTRNAPFATNDTPESRVRIIGSQLIALEDSPRLGPTSRASSGRRLTPLTSSPLNLTPRRSASDSVDQNRFAAASLNPHFVVPAIPSAPPLPPSSPVPDRLRDAVGDKTGINTQLVGTQLEQYAFPQRRPGVAALEPWEEDRLRRRVLEDLGNFHGDRTHLKDVYIELTGFDRRLTGNVSFADLGFAFNRCNVPLSVPTLRELCCTFVSDNDTTLVNYEKVLSFIASSLQATKNDRGPSVSSPGSASSRPAADYPSTVGGYDGRGILNPITGQVVNYRKTTSETLMKAVGDEISKSHHNIDFELLWETFARADRTRNNSFSFAQMKTLADACRIPLSDSVLEQLIDRCHKGNGLYGWQQFLEYLGQFLPQKTALDVSGARRQADVGHRTPAFDTGQQTKFYDQPNVSEVRERLDREVGVEDARSWTTALPSGGKNSWSESFRDLTRALYRSDVSHTGRIASLEASWLAREYNGAFGLGFSDDQINRAIAQGADGNGSVVIESFLQTLAAGRQSF